MNRPRSRSITPRHRQVAPGYLLWALGLFGICGLQRFYARKPVSGTLWLLTFGLCYIGQLVDLFLIPELVDQANQPLLLAEALEALEASDPAGTTLPPLDLQLLSLARRAGASGFTYNDALLECKLPRDTPRETVRQEIERLLHDDLLDVGNDERGRVVYREP
ncbi:TM2 domain-containing protein [Synechococcus sp. BSF8S]|uniref:TM2 domain-containing protein n=1 Tax=Synechococcales TaxID=1890424 RepID=UPI001627A2B8|nr:MULTISPECIES: TM2 domain-containing protein [unclassified Synechococcus]MBC1260131.1 TM2 domain-containing protein [Synechococcus sp. BSF8S]MBC1263052.1 TM2 domain-containing protein [Synechococcus sp. BSA11S]MCT0248586.1 TM2 domain-containing protein [Synechococcus sp. CS-205]